MNALLELKSVSAAYNGLEVLKNVNLTIKPNDFIGVIGPNGGGKTTLLKVILGLMKPKKGELIFPSGEIKMGYLPQVNQIDQKFPISVGEVVISGTMSKKRFITRHTKSDYQKRDLLLKQTGLLDLRNRQIGELSGGQLQRVLLCRALMSNPDLLILDEPETFVDNKFEGELYAYLKELNSKMAIVMVSHDVGTITSHIKTIACVNQELHYHESNTITEKQLELYNCPIQIISHGEVPHTVLKHHHH